MKEKNKAVFLDRDGIINRKPSDGDYVKTWEEFDFLPGVNEAIKKLKDNGFLIVIVTNQRGIAKGLMTKKDLDKIHRMMKKELEKGNAHIDKIYYCPHDLSEKCKCRKPEPGMLKRAASDLKIDLKNSWMIGDSESDIRAGKKAGCRTIIIIDKKPEGNKHYIRNKADYKASSLSESVQIILNNVLHEG